MFAGNAIKKDKKVEDEGYGTSYMNSDKTTVLQEARTFHETPLKARKCVRILTKLLVVIGQGERLGKVEATETFFAMTKLFQSKDHNIRRMLYLVIKELSVFADDVIIVTSSLIKDMTGSDVDLRAPAIRALCTITDATMIQSVDRYLKQAIVDKSPAIASAVLTSAFKLFNSCPDIIKRWVNEIQEAACSSRVMVEYHALGLLYMIRRSDRLAIMKMINKFTSSSLRSSYAHCIMLRIVSKQLNDEGLQNSPGLLDFLELSLRNKSEMVTYEAARSIISLKGVSAKDLSPAISVLQLLCSSPKPALRYAAVRTLNTVAATHPPAVAACNLDLEQLIADPNRSVATLAITTLLKTGNENNVERLLKHVCPFMSEITDEFKIVVLDSIRALAAKYPKKFTVLIDFLSNLLRDSAAYPFKKAVVSVIEAIIKDIPEAKSSGLLQLCEFIEDCEYVKLTQRILHLLGREGPVLENPRQFTRYIYNRIVLESSPVRCTATTALARFAAQNAEIRPSILVLLKRIMLDEDDEVRDRAAFCHYILSSLDTSLKSSYLLSDEMHLSPSGLERALLDYTQDAHASVAGRFSLATVPVAPLPQAATTVSLLDGIPSAGERERGTRSENASEPTPARRGPEMYAEQLASIPQFSKLGPLFKSSIPVELTEPDTEYTVTCVKHIYSKHLVLQYECTNTMSDQILENVKIEAEPEDSEFTVLTIIPCSLLPYNVPNSTYVLIQLPEDQNIYSTTFTNNMKFTIKDADSDSSDSGLPDEYQLEEFSFDFADQVQRILKGNFSLAWQEFDEINQAEETYQLEKQKTIKDAVKQVVDFLGLQPCERSDKMTTQENKSSHQLLLSGVIRGGHEVLVHCKFVRTADAKGVTLNIKARSSSLEISQLVVDAIC